MSTLLHAIDSAAARFDAAGLAYGQGVTEARDEAAWLALWQLGLPLDDLDAHAHRVLSAEEAQALEALFERRIRERLPAAYLTGQAWLQGVPFYIDPRAIIPRSYIAELIAEGRFDAWLGPHTVRVLDLCTGNGSLAVLAAMAWPEVTVVASDLSSAALAVAARNVERHGLQSRITLCQGDGLEAVRAHGPFDLVLCNPPYVNSASMARLPPEFRAEPALALDGGADGMDFIRPMLAGLAPLLSEHGVLVLEIGHEREHFERAFPQLSPVWLDTSAADDPVLLLTRSDLIAGVTRA